MKILLTHSLFPPDFQGGGEHYAFKTAEQLRRLGATVQVLCTGDPATADYAGIPTRRLALHPYRLNLAARTIAEHARGCDLIQTFNYHAALPSLRAARRLEVPVFCGILGLFGPAWHAMRGPLLGHLFLAFERYLASRPFDRVMVLSDESLQQCLALGTDPERCFINSPGVDLDDFALREEKSNSVLFAAKLERRKGIHQVLEVARALPEVPFRVAGWGDEAERIARQAPPNVTFLGYLSGEPLREEYRRSSIFILPTLAEGLPSSLLEAMAAQCAVVCSLHHDFAGARVDGHDVDGMAAAVERLWREPEQARECGRRNLDRVRDQSWDAYGDRLMARYRAVL